MHGGHCALNFTGWLCTTDLTAALVAAWNCFARMELFCARTGARLTSLAEGAAGVAALADGDVGKIPRVRHRGATRIAQHRVHLLHACTFPTVWFLLFCLDNGLRCV